LSRSPDLQSAPLPEIIAWGGRGWVRDHEFDALYPRWVRVLSRRHWTPVEVALRAVELLVDGKPNARILDVGSGPGKFCLVGALAGAGTFVGMERRPELVEIASNVARRLGVGERTEFGTGDAFVLDWARFDGVYLFNPFADDLGSVVDRMAVWPRFAEAVGAANKQLARLPRGARVVTYHGYGGPFPPGFERTVSERRGSGPLDLWIKTDA
jgi:SAM-dependent methyltransferase